MTEVHDHVAKCSVCHVGFDLRRSTPVLHERRLKHHDVYQCPNCGYLVATVRSELTAV